MKYYIIEKTEKTDEIFIPEKIPIHKGTKNETYNDDITFLKGGKIDLNNLGASSFHHYLTLIPKENLEEMNAKGKTTYSLITKTTITLEK